MKQAKQTMKVLAFLLFGISCITVSAQNASTPGSSAGKLSRDAAKQKQQYYHDKKVDNAKPLPAAEYEQKKLQRTPAIQKKLIPAAGNPQAGQTHLVTPGADRKQTLLQLRAAAAAKGLPTEKYDLELKKLNN